MTKTIGELKNKAKVIATIPTDYQPLLGVACVGETDVWIYGNKQTIARIDLNETVKDTVITTGLYKPPRGVALTRQGKLIFSDDSSKTVNIVRDGKSETLVVDKTGRVQFRYNGTPANRKAVFNPRGIVTDALNQIIVADYNNKCVHIIDQNGQFAICVDNCGLEKPYGLSVDSRGRLWVGCESGKIAVIEYLKNE